MSSGDHDKFEEEKFMKILVNLKDTQESIQGFSGWCIKNRKAAYKMARCWIKVIKKVSLCLPMIVSVLTSNIHLQVRIEQKLVLFYLVNDIVQHSAKRNYGELLDKFRSGIKEAMPHLKVDSRHFQVTAPFSRRKRLDLKCSVVLIFGRRGKSLTQTSFRYHTTVEWYMYLVLFGLICLVRVLKRCLQNCSFQELTGLIDLTPVKEDEEIVENFQPTQLCTQVTSSFPNIVFAIRTFSDQDHESLGR